MTRLKPGRALAKNGISRFWGIDEGLIHFSVNEYGKPSVSNYPDIHFNISYSENYVVCAVSDSPIGIDIEAIRPRSMKIAERFFTKNEYSYIVGIQPIDIQQHKIRELYRFYEIWTKKESYLKLLGKGLSVPLSSFSVIDHQYESDVVFHKVSISNDIMCNICFYKEFLGKESNAHDNKKILLYKATR